VRVVAALSLIVSGCASPHAFSTTDRARVQRMLRFVSADVKEHYYDPAYHGVDWDAAVARAAEAIERSTSLDMAMGALVDVLDSLDDSHTYFIPPASRYRHEYGLRFQMVGDRCLVTQVKPGSDAESKGVRAGQEIVAVEGIRVTRATIGKVESALFDQGPRPRIRLRLNRATADAALEVLPRVRQIEGGGRYGAMTRVDYLRNLESVNRRNRGRAVAVGGEIVVFKLPSFDFSREELDETIKKLAAYPSMVLDLRGNPGGSVESLRALVGALFEGDVKIADERLRRSTEPIVALAEPRYRFGGKLVVLIDSRSASSAEVLARVVQIEQRGTVLGDRSSGSVMAGRLFRHEVPVGQFEVVLFGNSVTVADVVTTDGKSLEHTGVQPDERVVPTADDVAQGSDPVLARAIELLGGHLDAGAAGKLFPYEWPSL
jgi:carboxyl-terminal processing protease